MPKIFIFFLFLVTLALHTSGCLNHSDEQNKVTEKEKNLRNFHDYELMFDSISAAAEPDKKLLLRMDSAAESNPGNAKLYRDNAYEAVRITDEFIQYLNNIKDTLLSQNGGRGEDGQLKSASDMSVGEKYFLNPIDKQTKGKELMQKINNTRKNLLNLLDVKDRITIKTDLRAEDNHQQGASSWQEETFISLPLAAVFATLTMYEIEAKKLKTDVIAVLEMKVTHK